MDECECVGEGFHAPIQGPSRLLSCNAAVFHKRPPSLLQKGRSREGWADFYGPVLEIV